MKIKGGSTFVFCPFCECKQTVMSLDMVMLQGYECKFCYSKVGKDMIVTRGGAKGDKQWGKDQSLKSEIRTGKIRFWGEKANNIQL